MPSGYKLANSNQWIAYTKGIHNVNITPTSSTNVILGNDNGLNYRYIPKTSTIEFIDGTLWMFADCDLHELNLPDNFDPQNVKNFAWMFIGNHNLTSLNLGRNFDTRSGTDMSSMFSDDNSLSTLDLGQKFYTNNVSDMQHMFDSDYSLKTLHFGNHFNTSNVNNMYDMFIKDRNLHLELPDQFDTRKALHNPTTIDDANKRNDGNGLANMFLNTNLKYLKINSANTTLNKATHLPEIWYYNNGNYAANLTHLGTWYRP